MKKLFITLTLLIATLSAIAAPTKSDITGNWYTFRAIEGQEYSLSCYYDFRNDGTMTLSATLQGEMPYEYEKGTMLSMQMQFLMVAEGTWTLSGSSLDTEYDSSTMQVQPVAFEIVDKKGKVDADDLAMLNSLLNNEAVRAEFTKEINKEFTKGFNGESFEISRYTSDTITATSAEGDTVNFERR